MVQISEITPKNDDKYFLAKMKDGPSHFPSKQRRKGRKKAKRGPVFSSIIEMVFSRSGHQLNSILLIFHNQRLV